MDEIQKLKEQLEQLRSKLQTEVTDKVKAELKSQMDAIEKKMTDLSAKLDEVGKVTVKLDEIDNRLKGIDQHMAEQKKLNSVKVDEESLDHQLKGKLEHLKSMKEGVTKEGISLKVSLKAATNVTTGSYTGGTVGLTDLLPGLATLVRRQPFLRELVNVVPLNNKTVAWVEQAAQGGAAGQTAEAGAKSQADFGYVERTMNAVKSTAFMKSSKESLDDIARLRADINSEIITLLQLQLDTQLLTGDGTGQNLKGINTYTSALSVTGTPFAVAGGGVKSANRFDVIRVAAWFIASNNFIPSYVAINPLDAALMDVAKNTQGTYVMPPFQTANGQQVAGVQIIINNGIASDNFTLGDFKKANLALREDINLSVGYDGNDFTNNMVTILGELRAAHFIRTNHLNAFTKGTFSTLITAMSV